MPADPYLEQLRSRRRPRTSPRPLADLLASLRRGKAFKASSRLSRFDRAWRAVVGEEIAAASKVTAYREGELKVTVTSQALAHEIGTFREREVVAALNHALDGKDRVARLTLKAGRLPVADAQDELPRSDQSVMLRNRGVGKKP